MSTLTPTLDHLDRLTARSPKKQAEEPSKASTSPVSKARKRPAR
jgi:hypothetical protein